MLWSCDVMITKHLGATKLHITSYNYMHTYYNQIPRKNYAKIILCHPRILRLQVTLLFVDQTAKCFPLRLVRLLYRFFHTLWLRDGLFPCSSPHFCKTTHNSMSIQVLIPSLYNKLVIKWLTHTACYYPYDVILYVINWSCCINMIFYCWVCGL